MAVSDGEREVATKFIFKGDRDSVRDQSVREACRLLIDFIGGKL
jgi:nicotinamide mononucleotide (NMN) deamidase PncC